MPAHFFNPAEQISISSNFCGFLLCGPKSMSADGSK
ncbi:hypothetical protein EVA_13940 [gut metagenome]|uniref:Uncharacterized protein n=1 Tax=gut metagenome TaxID=749906 RepID=J9FSL2_9ZZZZ